MHHPGAAQNWARAAKGRSPFRRNLVRHVRLRRTKPVGPWIPFASKTISIRIEAPPVPLRAATFKERLLGQIGGTEAGTSPHSTGLTGKTAPRTGLEGKFSIYHAVAVA